jgi:hypothetical protein
MRNRFAPVVLALVCLGSIVVLAKQPKFLSEFFQSIQSKPAPHLSMPTAPAATATPVNSNQRLNPSIQVNSSGITSTIPEPVTWLFLFRQISTLEDKAQAAESKGEDGSRYRTLYKRIANLTDGQNSFLMQSAISCANEVKIKDDLARQVTTRLRAQQPALTPGTAPVPAAMPELAELQKERDEIIMRYRQNIKDVFGPDFDRFEAFVHSSITSNITPNLKQKAAAPPPRDRNAPPPAVKEGNNQ